MPTKTKKRSNGASENAAAAHATLEDAGSKIGKAADTMLARIHAQDEEIADLSEALATEQSAHERDVEALTARAIKAEEAARVAKDRHDAMRHQVLAQLS